MKELAPSSGSERRLRAVAPSSGPEQWPRAVAPSSGAKAVGQSSWSTEAGGFETAFSIWAGAGSARH
jgi:hypothetical protein